MTPCATHRRHRQTTLRDHTTHTTHTSRQDVRRAKSWSKVQNQHTRPQGGRFPDRSIPISRRYDLAQLRARGAAEQAEPGAAAGAVALARSAGRASSSSGAGPAVGGTLLCAPRRPCLCQLRESKAKIDSRSACCCHENVQQCAAQKEFPSDGMPICHGAWQICHAA